MTKSQIIHSFEQYKDWMTAKELWTNPNYQGSYYDTPSRYPVIVLADYSMDYDNRYRVHTNFVYKSDFE